MSTSKFETEAAVFLGIVIAFGLAFAFSHRKIQAKVIKLKPVCQSGLCKGQYTFTDNGSWYYYNFVYSDTTGYSGKLPPSGMWQEGNPPRSEDEEEETEMSLSEDAEGTPNSAPESIDNPDTTSADSNNDAGSDGGSGGDGD